MKTHTVKSLAKMAGVSVKTLHHYDKIGLLKPHKRSDSDYRLYGEIELLRLQQILIYREMDMPLEEIKSLMNDPHYSLKASLENQREAINKKVTHLKTLLRTIDRTLDSLNQKTTMTDEELYEGLSPEKAKEYKEEATQRWGDEVQKTEERIRKMGPEKWKAVKEEGHAIAQKLADLMASGKEPTSPEAQEAIALHFRHLHHFYEVSEERYRGLGNMYAADPRFRATYDQYHEGLADFINEGIQAFCDNGLKTLD